MTAKPWLCGAKTRSGGTCGQRAGWGTGHPGTGRCRNHGGSSPQAELSGQLVIARSEAQVMGVPLPMEPHEAILQCIAIAAGEVRYASERIADLELDESAGPVVTTLTRPLKFEKGAESDEETVTEVRHEAPALHIWIRTRREAMDRLVQYSAVALKAGVEERKVRVAENMGATISQVMQEFARRMGLDPAAPEVREAGRAALTVIAGGA